MGWLGDNWAPLVGWGGSALVVLSLLQARILRLRLLNLVGCLVLVFFNSVVGVWPMVGMNAALCLINVWFLVPLLRSRHDPAAYAVLQVSPEDRYLSHVLQVHAEDIRRFRPGLGDPTQLTWQLTHPKAYLVLREDEMVGMVMLEVHGDVARVVLDHVTVRFRDFSPGEFVWRRSALLDELGVNTVLCPADTVDPYYAKVGFAPAENGAWVLSRTQRPG